MERKELIEFIKKLENIESEINKDDNLDDNFMDELKSLFNKFNDDPKQNYFNVPVKIKRITENAVIPKYSKPGDAGMDLTITSIISNTTFDVTYGFGISLEIPKGYVGLIFPRSSVRNMDLLLTNCVGVIDSGYRGEIQATFKKTNGFDSFKYNINERGAQIIILPYPQIQFIETEELNNSERGHGGFGSTGI